MCFPARETACVLDVLPPYRSADLSRSSNFVSTRARGAPPTCMPFFVVTMHSSRILKNVLGRWSSGVGNSR